MSANLCEIYRIVVCARDSDAISGRFEPRDIASSGGCLLLASWQFGIDGSVLPETLETYREGKKKRKNPRTDLAAGIKMQVVRACALLVAGPTSVCFMADSFVCSAVGIIFPSKLRYTGNNGEIKT